MLWFVGWIVLSLLMGWGGTQKGRSFAFGFLWSLVLSPLVGLILVLLSRELPREASEGVIYENQMLRQPANQSELRDAVLSELSQRGHEIESEAALQQFDRWFEQQGSPEFTPGDLANLYEAQML